MLCTQIVFCFDIQNNLCTPMFYPCSPPCSELVIFMYWTRNSMNNLLSYCGLVDARIRAYDKDLPVQKKSTMIVQSLFLSSATSVVILLKPGVIWSIINVWCMKITNQKNAHSAIDDFLQKLYWKNMLCDLIIRKEFCAMIVEKYLAAQNCLKGRE